MANSVRHTMRRRAHDAYQRQPGRGRTSSVNARAIQCIVAAVLALGLAGCGEEETADLRAYVADVKARKKSNIPPLPKPKSFETFTYDGNALRDPFVPTAIIEAVSNSSTSGLRPDTGRAKDVLEQFSIGSLKMMGVLEKDGRIWALIRASDGTLYRTKVGRHMGQNNGEIIKITENQLELREIIPDGLGGWTERFTTLAVNE